MGDPLRPLPLLVRLARETVRIIRQNILIFAFGVNALGIVLTAWLWPLLAPTPALPGFAIVDGRLTWATPPGQDGQGSSLQLLAWSGNERGRVETTPLDGSEPVVVIR